MQQESVWDGERISNIGWILSRYSEHVQEGDRVRMGIEGDPCSTYRGIDGASAGTVDRVRRDDYGFVQLTVTLDSGKEVELDNRNIAPAKVWEIHPDFVNVFRGRVQKSNGDGEEHDGEEHNDDTYGDTHDFRSAVETQVETLGERLKRMENAGTELERTIASAVRELAGDLMRTYRGEEPEFSFRYADRYDLALTKSSKSDDDSTATYQDDFRGPTKNSSTKNVQSEKYAFDIESLGLRESSVLSD